MQDFFKNLITNNKNKIVIASVAVIISFAVFIGAYFLTKNSFIASIDMSQNIGKYSVINDDLYTFNEVGFKRFSSRGSLKANREIANKGNVKTGNDVVYSLIGNELILYNKNFEEVKKIVVDGSNLDFFVEDDKVVVVNDKNFKIFDSTLKLIYEQDAENVLYLKFSKEKNKIVYIDYTEYKVGFKTRFHIVDYAEKKTVNGFTFYNEMIVDFGFLKDNSKDLYILTNDKLYTFEGGNIKNSYFTAGIKDFKYADGKFYILSKNVDVLNAESLEREKTINPSVEYDRINVFKGEIVLSSKNSYAVVNKKDEIESFNENILDIIQNSKGIYIVFENGYRKIK